LTSTTQTAPPVLVLYDTSTFSAPGFGAGRRRESASASSCRHVPPLIPPMTSLLLQGAALSLAGPVPTLVVTNGLELRF
jgi:hypothetical protein